jgi:alpha-tubulin suppressor-like RCC1 family protein
MDPLLLLVRHGAFVWMASLAGMVLAAVLADLRRRRRTARSEAVARWQAIGAPTTQLDGAGGALITLRGRLEAGGVLCRRFEDGAPVAAASAGSGRAEAIAAARAERLALRTRAGVVRLDGPVEVVVGEIETRTADTPEQLDAAVRARIDEAGGVWATPDPVVLRSVSPGAEVLVRGVLHRGDDGDGPGGYRTGGGALRLAPPPVGEDGASAGLRLAYDGGPRAGRSALRGTVLAAGAAVALFGVVFLAVPEIQGRRPIYGERLAALLAATPLHRARGVAAYTAMLEAGVRSGPVDVDRFERLVGLYLAQGHADRAVGLLMDHGQWVRAGSLAEDSGLPILAARAAFERGELELAAQLWDKGSPRATDAADLIFGLRVHLLAGDVEGARAAAHRAADRLADLDRPELGCIASALDGMRGDRSALERLGVVAERSPLCAMLLADLEERTPHGSASYGPDELNARAIAGLTRSWGSWAVASTGCTPWPPSADALLGPGRAPPRWGLIRAVLEDLQDHPRETHLARLFRARLAAEMAAFESAAGEHDEAIRWTGVMMDAVRRQDGDPMGPFEVCGGWRGALSALDLVQASVLLRAGRVEEARRILVTLPDVPEAKVAAALARALPLQAFDRRDRERASALDRSLARGPWSASPADLPVEIDDTTFRAAIQGGGVMFAAQLQRTGTAPEQLLRVAGFTLHDGEDGRGALAAWLRGGRAPRCHGCDVASRFDDVTARLALAEELGDGALVAEIRPIVQRFRAAILRRETAVPLLALEQLGMAWTPPEQLALGDRHSCALFAGGTVRCWGANDHGQLGDGTTDRRTEPTPVPGLDGVAQIAAGGDDTCARMRDGTVRCWGARGDHGPGSGTTAPVPVPGIEGATTIAVGHDRACAVLADGFVTCWGEGRGPCRRQGVGASTVLMSVAGTPARVKSLALGGAHACAALEDGSVQCWGANDAGQIGVAGEDRCYVATRVPDLHGVTQLSAGDAHTCAIRSGPHDAVCWGAGAKGQIGNEKARPRSGVEKVSGLWYPAVVAAGGSFACAIQSGSVSCWGAGARGQLGIDDTDSHDSAMRVGFSGIVEVAAGGAHACMRTSGGEIWCWGAGRDGQVGDGTTLDHLRPTRLRL